MKQKVIILPSIMCSTPDNMKAYVRAFEENGIDAIHFDVMDGHYVPNIMLGVRDYQFLKSITDIPVDIHLMCREPELFIEYMKPQAGDWISFHPETAGNPYRLLQVIKDRGCLAGIAISPGVPISYIAEMAGILDYVLVMAVNPGFASQKMIPDLLDKLRRVRELIGCSEKNIPIYVDGNTTKENARTMLAYGACGLVTGTSSMMKEEVEGFGERYAEYMKNICV